MAKKNNTVNHYPEPKPWGVTTSILQDRVSHIDQLQIVPGGYSSRHLHKFKSNAFIIHVGVLTVRVWPKDLIGGLLSTLAKNYYLKPGGPPLTIPPGVVHQFVAAAGEVIATEVYTLMPPLETKEDDTGKIRAIDRFDISRYSENGILKEYDGK